MSIDYPDPVIDAFLVQAARRVIYAAPKYTGAIA